MISESPTHATIVPYIEILKRKKIDLVVRICEPLYDSQLIRDANINFVDLCPSDAHATPHLAELLEKKTIDKWIELIYRYPIDRTIAIHCVTGYGKSVLLVLIYLIEQGMDSKSAINYVRNYGRGSFDVKQSEFLHKYSLARNKIDSKCCNMI
jgi:protein-tyrosine phosphatase